jgi:multiple sugar transport system ATP-binding protein
MTVAENMGFSLRLKNASKHEMRASVEKAARILGLEALLNRYPRELSGGQRQRVAMGRAIVRDPKVFLFDEPLSNLDAKLRIQMRSEIKELHQRLKTTTVYVTHDQIEAMTMADKIVVMRGGIVEQAGAPLDIYDRPANMFVAGFIGSPSMNFLDGNIVDGRFVMSDGTSLPLPDHAPKTIGKPVCYGIRPEHFQVSTEGANAQVLVVEPTGSETYLLARMSGASVASVAKDRLNVSAGDTLKLMPDISRVHLFDKESGRRL